MKKATAIFFAAIIAQCPAICRPDGDEILSEFQDSASYRAILYRGKAATEYRTLLYNGNPYWEDGEFRAGTVSFCGKTYRSILLNIDACGNKLLVRYSENTCPVILEDGLVEKVEIDGRHFVNLRKEGFENAAEGWYMVLCDSPRVFERVDKRLRTSAENVNGDPIGYYDPNYRFNATKYYYRDETFLWIKDGKLRKISRRKALTLSSK